MADTLAAGRRQALLGIYRDGLLDDTLRFWLPRAVDREHGGYWTCFDRDGTLLDTDKAVWFQGRFAWLLSELYNTVERREEWLDAARSGVEFLRRHCFDVDGRMFFMVTREGRPLRKRRYAFSECFAAMAFAAYARAAKDERAAEEARSLFENVQRLLTTPGLLEPKVNPQTRAMKGLGIPMILIGTAQVLRDNLGAAGCTELIDRCIEEVRRDFMKEEFRAVLETVGPRGESIDHLDGRTLNPGHAIEAAWFILQEAKHRKNDAELIRMGLTMLDWMWEWGWDEEYGGIIYYRDVKGGPCLEYWQDMKFWWPQNEAIIATLMAYQLTGDEKYARWHGMVHDWAYAHFPDPEHGEWYGYLHRDGRPSHRAKGTMWKGPFHLPRMQLVCWRVVEEMAKEGR
jgi:N-acylglucosamine 2-epimerase